MSSDVERTVPGARIHVGQSIPGDVTGFTDRFGDAFVRAPGVDNWDTFETATLPGPYIVKHYAPLTVTAVRAVTFPEVTA